MRLVARGRAHWRASGRGGGGGGEGVGGGRPAFACKKPYSQLKVRQCFFTSLPLQQQGVEPSLAVWSVR